MKRNIYLRLIRAGFVLSVLLYSIHVQAQYYVSRISTSDNLALSNSFTEGVIFGRGDSGTFFINKPGGTGHTTIGRYNPFTGEITDFIGNDLANLYAWDSGYGRPGSTVSFGGNASEDYPSIATDRHGNSYINCGEFYFDFNLIIKIDSSPAHFTHQFAGVGQCSHQAYEPGTCHNPSSLGDGGPADKACVPMSEFNMVIDDSDNLYLSDYLHIHKINLRTGIIDNYAGNGDAGPNCASSIYPAGSESYSFQNQGTFSGDGGPATKAGLGGYIPQMALDRQGNLYFVDASNNRVRKVDAATGIIHTIAGSGLSLNDYVDPVYDPIQYLSFSGDGGSATAATLAYPSGVAVDRHGNVFILDGGNGRIRMVDSATQIITTIAGNGQNAWNFNEDQSLNPYYNGCRPALQADVGQFDDHLLLDDSDNIYIPEEALKLYKHPLRDSSYVDYESTCNANATTGKAVVYANGGNPPYTYQWSNGGTSKTLDNVAEGIYKVTVQDAGGCTALNTLNVIHEPLITMALDDSIGCAGTSGTVAPVFYGGTPPYHFKCQK